MHAHHMHAHHMHQDIVLQLVYYCKGPLQLSFEFLILPVQLILYNISSHHLLGGGVGEGVRACMYVCA